MVTQIDLFSDFELKKIQTYLNNKVGVNEVTNRIELLAKMKSEMAEGICHFFFQKVTGELRECWGTRDINLINKYSKKLDESKKTPKKITSAHTSTFPYFDLICKDWRCFKVDSVLKLDEDYEI